MNLASLHEKLIAAARKHPPGGQVPHAFEQRVMARVRMRPPVDEWAQAIRSLWYGAAVCSVVALSMGVWFSTPDDELELAANFSQDIEQTLLPAEDADLTP